MNIYVILFEKKISAPQPIYPSFVLMESHTEIIIKVRKELRNQTK